MPAAAEAITPKPNKASDQCDDQEKSSYTATYVFSSELQKHAPCQLPSLGDCIDGKPPRRVLRGFFS